MDTVTVVNDKIVYDEYNGRKEKRFDYKWTLSDCCFFIVMISFLIFGCIV